MRVRTARARRFRLRRHVVGAMVGLGCLAGGWPARAAAQTYYKWTDAQGLVHFSDAPPPAGRRVEQLNLPGAPARPAAPPAATPASAGAPRAPAPSSEETTAPARIVVTRRKMPRTGPSTLHITGEVKNVGGGSARDVLVTATAVDANSGDECFREDIRVEPSALGAGDAGSFDAEFENPCFFGQPKLDLTPVWVSTEQPG